MFVRLLQLKIKPDEMPAMAVLYESKILPALQSTGECVCAFLMQSVGKPEEAISLTLWQSEDASSAYERSGLFMRLVADARPFFAESTDWKLRLSEDLTLEYRADDAEPAVKRYSLSAATGPSFPAHEPSNPMFLRIVVVHLKPGMLQEYRTLYEENIVPALVATHGCAHACLLAPAGDGDEAISVTVWRSRVDADAYERSGAFRDLLRKVSHTLTDLSQMGLESAGTRLPSVTSEDVRVEGYRVIAGRNL
ncbi:MAG TPA: antibiotic biosynthesis monooxygenase [Bacteroidota bacterium]|nr:antibiotic biosynthesis monooxygenase [Bacteroidota bacterium]